MVSDTYAMDLQTRALVRSEGIITQLVFNHALRIRMKAELPAEGTSSASNPSTTIPSPDNASVVDQPVSAEASESSNSSGDETLAQGCSTSIKSATESSKGKQKAKDSQPAEDKAVPKEAAADNLVGKINNLVTTDLNNITEARDFLFLCKHLLRLR